MKLETQWISVKDRLPEGGKYVLCRHTRGTWRDSQDQENVNCVVLKFVRGISIAEREKMAWDSSDRKRIYKSEDEHGNNQRPYNWQEFGPDSFFGQDISHWMPLPEPPKE